MRAPVQSVYGQVFTIASGSPSSSAQNSRPAHRPAFCSDCKERGHEARGFGEWQVIDWARRRPGQAEAVEGGLGGAFSYHRFRTAACLEMRKAATRSVSRPGRVMVRHLWMPGGHRRGPPLGFLSYEFHHFGNRVTRLMGEDRERVPGTRFMRHFEVGKGPDPALLPLPQVCDRHRAD